MIWFDNSYELVATNSVCFNMSCLTTIISMEAKLMLCYCYFQSLLSDEIAFWEGATTMEWVLKVQNKIVRIMAMTSI
jgi:hypothetical protein